MTPEEEHETRAEAKRLANLTLDERKAFVAMLQSDARNRRLAKRDRELSRERAELLAKLLRLKT